MEPDVSIVSSVNSSDDIDMLPDAQLADGLEDAGYCCYYFCCFCANLYYSIKLLLFILLLL